MGSSPSSPAPTSVPMAASRSRTAPPWRAADAVKPGASLVWDACAGNLSADGEVGDKPSTDVAFAGAAHIVSLETWINRVTGVPMEPRTAIGDYDSASGRYTIYAGTGVGVVRERQILAAVLDVPEEQCRAVCGDMGGNFGTRNSFFPEYGLLPWAARRIGRPVEWYRDRTEC